MKKIKWLIIFIALVNSLAAIEVINKDKTKLDINGRFQLLGTIQQLEDPYRDNRRFFLFMRQARLSVPGEYEDIQFKVQLAFAGEEEVKAPSPGVTLSLLDMYADMPVAGVTRLRFGQFKIPYSRERLLDSRDLQFSDRSISNTAFRWGRDLGVAAHGDMKGFTYALGMFAGGGRDVPERYIPQHLGTPLFVARVGYNAGADKDILTPEASGLKVDKPVYAAYLNGLIQQDSSIGHSTVMNVKLAEKSLLTNSNWNPLIARTPYSLGTLQQVGVDVVYRMPISQITLSTELEAHFGRYTNGYGELNVPGGRIQTTANYKEVELGLRYSLYRIDDFALFRNSKLYNLAPGGMKNTQEIALAFTWFMRENLKLIFHSSLIDSPVVTEKDIGVYSTTEQPDQVTYVATGGNSINRQTVTNLQMLLQYYF